MRSLAWWLDSLGTALPLIGYSQGGRIALQLAVERPDLVSHLVLISAGAGIADPAERRERREQDEATAVLIESIGVQVFLEEWLRRPTTSTTHLDEAVRERDLEARSVNTAPGLAAALRGLGQGAQPFVGDRLSLLAMPVLTIAGEVDRTYAPVSRDVAAAVPDGSSMLVTGAGHNVVLEAPDRVAAAVTAFLASSPDSRRPHARP